MGDLPTGTVTFLFTDIQGSTRLWEQHPEAMRVAVARHDVLLASCIEQHAGVVVRSRGEGDSFFAVFHRAGDAVGAACALQRALAAEPWPTPTGLCVRAALNTGEAELRDGDYYSTAVNRCARLRAIAHGGQTLLSQATYELVCDSLPAGVRLRDLGRHRLKDLQRPEQVYQLLHPELPAEFPALSSPEAFPHNLPRQLTSFVGREQEISRLRELLVGAGDEGVKGRRGEGVTERTVPRTPSPPHPFTPSSPAARLITLTGPGGTGKTRLALQVAGELIESFPDGVFFVDLSPISDATLVLSTIAQTLGVREAGGASLIETLKRYLSDRQVLLLLDNFEQVVAAAPLVADLLSSCPRPRLLVTSRTRLRLRGEHELRVPPLGLPAAEPRQMVDGRWSMVDEEGPIASTINHQPSPMLQFPAVELFVQRAVQAEPDFALTPERAPAVAEICRRLDGLPLAIELAAARVKLIPPQALLMRLAGRAPGYGRTPDSGRLRGHTRTSPNGRPGSATREPGARLRMLTGGARDLPVRHQTLRNAIAWSFDLLDPNERALLRRLSVFVGGCTLAAAEEVCADFGFRISDFGLADRRETEEETQDPDQIRNPKSEIRNTEVLDLLSSLVEKSLLTKSETELCEEDGEPRFRMLETIREYGVEALEESGEAAMLRQRHTLFFLELAEMAGAELHGPEQRIWLDRLEGEMDNLRAALAWCLAEPESRAGSDPGSEADVGKERGAMGLRLARAMGWFWYHRGHWSEGRAWLERAIERSDAGDRDLAAARARTLNMAGILAQYQGDRTAAQAFFEESLAVRRELGDTTEIASSLNNLGNVALLQGEYPTARARYEECLATYRRAGNSTGVTKALHNLAETARLQGDLRAARALYEEGLPLLRRLGNQHDLACSLRGLGDVARCEGNYPRAWALIAESLSLLRELGAKEGIADALRKLGQIAHGRDDMVEAGALYRESLEIERQLGNKQYLPECLEGLAAVAVAQGEARRAAQWFGAAEALREAIGSPLSPSEGEGYARCVAEAQTLLDEAAFTEAWTDGRSTRLEEVISGALGIPEGGDHMRGLSDETTAPGGGGRAGA